MKRGLFLTVLIAGVLGQGGMVIARAPEASPEAPGATSDVGAQWAVFGGCVEDPPRLPDESGDLEAFVSRQAVCAEAARGVVEAGTDSDRERLWSVFDALPDDTPLPGDVLGVFLDRDIERALAALAAASKPAARNAIAEEEMPAFLRDGPAELQRAWRLYQSVEETHEKAFDRPAADSAIAFQANEPAFRRSVAAFLRGRASAAATIAEVSRYEWGGWCGTGSGALYVPRSKALLLAYLQLGRVDLAFAAAGVLNGRFMGTEGRASGSDPRLLAAAGIDWESYHLGGVLSGRFDLAVPLVLHGSEDAARGLLAAARTFDAAGQEVPEIVSQGLSWPLAALVEPGESAVDSMGWSSREVGPRAADAEPVHADVQEGVLDLLANRVGPEAGRREAETASYLLAKLARTESREVFRAMLLSGYEDVRKHGAAGLRALGETVPDPLASRPVSFRLVVDGEPAANRALSWTLETSDGGGETSSAQTDAAGILRLERDGFVDPRHEVSSVRLQSRDVEAALDEWFGVTVDPPTDLDTVTTVSVRTGALIVVVPPALLAGAESRPPAITLHAMSDLDGSDVFAASASGEIQAVSGRMEFPHLQHGRYEVWLSVGSHLYLAPAVEVGDQPATTTIPLDPAYSPDVDEPADRAASPTNQPL